MEVSKLSDKELLKLYKSQNNIDDSLIISELFDRYKFLIIKHTKQYFLPDGDRDDLLQEGYIALFKSIRDFKLEKKVPFKNFASMCLRRHMISVIKTSLRYKNELLNNSISINKKLYPNNDNTLMDYISNDIEQDPESINILKESLKFSFEKMYIELTKLEYSCFLLYLKGYSYSKIAELLDITYSSVSNALYRAKNKLSKLNDEYDIA